MSNGDGDETPDEEVVQVDDSGEERERQIATLIEYEDILVENSEDLMNAFGSFFESNYDFNDLGKLWSNVNIVIKAEFDDLDEFADVANALINLVTNLDSETISELREEGANEDLVSLFKDLKIEYGHKLDREFNRLQKGRDWWSNIKTNAGFRSQRPTFEHELTIDYTETVVFNSSIDSTFILIDHFVRQLESVPKLVGEDVLLEMDKEQINDVIGRLESLKDDIEDYEEEIESITEESESTGDDEDTSTESEAE
jgi:hypothetical protein